MKKKSTMIKSKTVSLHDDLEFMEVDLNPLIKNFMIKEAFNMFDENHSGDIDRREFKKLIVTLGLEMDDKKIYELMKEIDKDGSGSIELEEFTKMMNKFQFSRDSPIGQHLESTFTLYDKDGDGVISARDIENVGIDLNGVFDSDEADMFVQLCKHFAQNKNLKTNDEFTISKEEFINMLISVNFIEEIKKSDPRFTDGNLNTYRSEPSETNQNVTSNGTNTNRGKDLSIPIKSEKNTLEYK